MCSSQMRVSRLEMSGTKTITGFGRQLDLTTRNIVEEEEFKQRSHQLNAAEVITKLSNLSISTIKNAAMDHRNQSTISVEKTFSTILHDYVHNLNISIFIQ